MIDQTKSRIVTLQKQLKIAREALTKVCAGCRDPEAIAGKALDDIWPLDRKQPLQSIVGHGRNAAER